MTINATAPFIDTHGSFVEPVTPEYPRLNLPLGSIADMVHLQAVRNAANAIKVETNLMRCKRLYGTTRARSLMRVATNRNANVQWRFEHIAQSALGAYPSMPGQQHSYIVENLRKTKAKYKLKGAYDHFVQSRPEMSLYEAKQAFLAKRKVPSVHDQEARRLYREVMNVTFTSFYPDDGGAVRIEFAPLMHQVKSARTGTIMYTADRIEVARLVKQGYIHDAKHNALYDLSAGPRLSWPRAKVLEVEGYKRIIKHEDLIVPPHELVTGTDYIIRGNVHASMSGYHSSRDRGYIDYREMKKLDVAIISGRPTYGCELELLPKAELTQHHAATLLLADHGEHIDIERDGSVSDGLEIVTGFGRFEDLDEVMRSVYEKNLQRFRISSKTGLHFHVGHQSIDTQALARLQMFFVDYKPLVTVVSGREPNRYCTIHSPNELRRPYGMAAADWVRPIGPYLRGEMGGVNRDGSRYHALNTQAYYHNNKQTFEWRSPKATVEYASWRARLEFIHLLTNWLVATPVSGELMRRVPTIDEFVHRLMDTPRDQTVGLRRLLTGTAGKKVLASLHATVVPEYNSRREFAALKV